MLINLIAGARLNFMKIAPLNRKKQEDSNIECQIVRNGQRYYFVTSQTFFNNLELPKPDDYSLYGKVMQLKGLSRYFGTAGADHATKII